MTPEERDAVSSFGVAEDRRKENDPKTNQDDPRNEQRQGARQENGEQCRADERNGCTVKGDAVTDETLPEDTTLRWASVYPRSRSLTGAVSDAVPKSRFSARSSVGHSTRPPSRSEGRRQAPRASRRRTPRLGGLEAVFPPDGEHLDRAFGRVDPRFDPADETVAKDDRQHVPAPAALVPAARRAPRRTRSRTGSRGACGPTRARRRGEERDGRRRLRRRLEHSTSSRTTKRFPLTPSTSTGTSSPSSTSSPASRSGRDTPDPSSGFAGPRYSKMPSPCPLAPTSPVRGSATASCGAAARAA